MPSVWLGAETGTREKGIDKETGKTIIEIDPKYFRPTEVESLLGDSTKAREKLAWKPRISFNELVKEMVDSDLKEAEKELHLKNGGFESKKQF